MNNIRFAGRMLRKNPGLTVVAVLTLGLGIGANTAIFSVVDAVLLRPLPYRDPGQLVSFANRFRDNRVPLSVMELEDYRSQAGVFDKAAAVLVFDGNMTGGDQPERVQAVGASANYFEILGVPAQLGHTFTSADQRPGWNEIAVISDGLWQRRFGGAPDILGKKMYIDEDPWVIVGVMPAGFKHPDAKVKGTIDVWLPSGFAAEPFPEPKRQIRYNDVIGRIKPGVDVAQGQVALTTVSERLKAQFPEAYSNEVASWGVTLTKLDDQVVGGARPVLLLLLGAVVLVLLIACSNVANLLLARATARAHEMAIRKALGATRWQVVSQLLTESVFLALVGGVLGLVIASWGLQVLLAFAPEGLPRVHEVEVDSRVLLFTVSVSVVSGILFGIFPALSSSRIEPQVAMKDGGASIGGSRRHRLLRGLVIGEFALALVVLGIAGLLLRSLWNAADVKPGFDATGVLTARLWLPQPNKLEAGKYNKFEQRDLLYRGLIDRLEAEPAVESAAIVSTVPLEGDPSRNQIGITPEGEVAKTELQIVQARVISPDYWKTLRIPLVGGRNFAVTDHQKAPQVAIVNQTLARHFWPGADVLGKRFRRPPNPNAKQERDPWITIVGVVADVKTSGLDAPTPDEIYLPATQGVDLATGVVIRARGGSAAAMATILRQALHAIDPDLPLFEVATLDQVLTLAMAARKFLATLIALFAAVALALAALGIYGVMAYAVSQRRKEIALRMALGAKERDVLGMVIGQGLRLVATSIVVGVAALFVFTRLIASLLFGVSPTDTVTFGSIGAILVVVALVASWLPARRAARVSPMAALRSE